MTKTSLLLVADVATFSGFALHALAVAVGFLIALFIVTVILLAAERDEK